MPEDESPVMFVLKSFRAASTLLKLQYTPPRTFTSSKIVSAAARLPPRPVIKEEDLEEAFLKGSGPGGQKIVCRFALE